MQDLASLMYTLENQALASIGFSFVPHIDDMSTRPCKLHNTNITARRNPHATVPSQESAAHTILEALDIPSILSSKRMTPIPNASRIYHTAQEFTWLEFAPQSSADARKNASQNYTIELAGRVSDLKSLVWQ